MKKKQHLLKKLQASKQQIKGGKGKVLRSFKDLRNKDEELVVWTRKFINRYRKDFEALSGTEPKSSKH